MMGGNELIMKKEKNLLETELQREEWMKKPEEEMTDEEKHKYKEFLQKEKDIKEKQRKAWEANLKRCRNDVIDIQAKFEEHLHTLYKKKLFYDARIYEQELYMVRLTIMLHDVLNTKVNNVKTAGEFEKSQDQLEQKNNFHLNCKDQLVAFEQEIKGDS